MAYTPPSPVNLDFTQAGYVSPSPVNLEFDSGIIVNTLVDSLSVSESISVGFSVNVSVSVTESSALSDTQTVDYAAAATGGDVGIVIDSLASNVTLAAAVTDSLGLSDISAVAYVVNAALTDTATVSALPIAAPSFSADCTEPLTATDSWAFVALTIDTFVSDSAQLSEAVYSAFFRRYLTAEVCAATQQAQPLAVFTALTTQQPTLGRADVLAALEQASSLRLKTASAQAIMLASRRKICVQQDPATAAAQHWRIPYDALTQRERKLCATVDNTRALSVKVAAKLPPSEFVRKKLAATVQDTGLSTHILLRSYYPEPESPYIPSTDFVIDPVSSFVDEVVNDAVYIPHNPRDLDFTPAGYVPPSHPALNLGADNLTQVPHHYQLSLYNAPFYVASTLFNVPYTLIPVITKEVEQLGVLRQKVCAKPGTAVAARLKRCVPVEPARRPPPGQSFINIDPPRDPPPIPSVVYTIPSRSSYMINHVLSVTLLDGTPIQLATVNLSLDVDSYAWNFKGSLADKAELPLVQQPANGDPVQLKITVNGVLFTVIVERIDHSRQFGERQINLSGRGLTALLGQPYEQLQSATQASELSIQQLAELQLPTGAVSGNTFVPWTIDWQCPTWLVPNGAFTYTAQTPIQVLMGMANDIGAIIKPSRTARSMVFMPRYKVGPWQFAVATPDLIVPEAAIFNLTARPPIKVDINGVYVHGGEVGGVIGWCRLSGSDGARLAQTVSNNLITDVAAARLLGERILAANQTQPAIQSITLPMENDVFPLAEVGWLAQITVDGTPVRGIINSVSLDVQPDSVRQTLQIGEETPNTWTLFKNLLPRDPLLVGTLSSTDGASSLLTLLDGGVIRVRGTGTVGSKYYVRLGRIEGEAPNLTQFEVVV